MIVRKFIQKIHDGKVKLPELRAGYSWVLKLNGVSIVDQNNSAITSWIWTKFSDGDGIKIKWFKKAKKEVESCNYWERQRNFFDVKFKEAKDKHNKGKGNNNGKNI